MQFRPRTLIFWLLGAGLVAGLVVVAFRTEPVPVDLATVGTAPMQITVNAEGKTEIREVYEVSAPVAGSARRSPVSVGDHVVAGETVVAVVEPVAPALLDARTRLEAEAALREADASVHVAETALAQAGEDRDHAQVEFDRTRTLVQRGVASTSRLEDDTQALARAEAAVAAAQSRLELAQSARDRAAVVLAPADAPGSQGGCCIPITAPISGTVLAVDQISARSVAPGTRLLAIGRPDDLRIVADLLSSDAVRLAPGARAIVERWGGEQALEALLVSIDPVAATRVSALGIEEQRVDAGFDLTSPPAARPGLGGGFAVFLRIVEWETGAALQVPLSALFRAGQGWAVFVVTDGVAQQVPVEIGRRNETMAQVLGGLEEGARVVTHPGENLTDGAAVVERGQ